jgi:Zn-dependent protease
LAGIDFGQVFLIFLVLLLSLTVHEAAHAWSAEKLGDSTARMLGRVSLNPAVHIDPIGTILFPLIAILTNLPVLGWAKPVPVNILNLRRNWKEKYMVIAAAGPASNLVLATIAAVLLLVVGPENQFLDSGREAPLALFLRRMVVINVFLAVFNMIPVPPLDGGNVLSGLLRGQASEMFDRLRPYGFLILYGLLLTGVVDRLIVPPAEALISLLL